MIGLSQSEGTFSSPHETVVKLNKIAINIKKYVSVSDIEKQFKINFNTVF
jgi:hypothetical protein